MSERPILFSSPMVRAILSGTKTQTRRIVRFTASSPGDVSGTRPPDEVRGPTETTSGPSWMAIWNEPTGWSGTFTGCPYGRPGDRLWVRETCLRFTGCQRPGPWPDGAWTLSPDGDPHRAMMPLADADPEVVRALRESAACVSVPSIFMPRWASRLTLEVESVRVERLQDIAVEDIIAEGLTTTLREHDAVCDLRDQWARLWDSINADRAPLASNPWVWVVGFRRVTP